MQSLKIEHLCRNFGGVAATNNVSFSVEQGEHLAIIGPNGAGKTTLFNLLTGALKPTGGKITFYDKEITNMSENHRTHMGISRSFQITSLFNKLSVLENMLLALQGTKKGRFRMLTSMASNHTLMIEAEQWLHKMDIYSLKDEPVFSIAYGQQRKLEIAMAMASSPRLLLLDEPGCGLTAAESHSLTEMISRIDKDITVICVDHDMDLVFRFASRIMVLHYGELIKDGLPEDIKACEKVKECYLGR